MSEADINFIREAEKVSHQGAKQVIFLGDDCLYEEFTRLKMALTIVIQEKC